MESSLGRRYSAETSDDVCYRGKVLCGTVQYLQTMLPCVSSHAIATLRPAAYVQHGFPTAVLLSHGIDVVWLEVWVWRLSPRFGEGL